jgi:D-ribose pyranase
LKKIGLLNKDLSEVIAGMGHTQRLVVCDAGLPIQAGVRRIDLAIKAGLPGFIETLEAILGELQVEKFIIAQELNDRNPLTKKQILDLLPSADYEEVPHECFKELTNTAVAIVRTGEFSAFANIILISGVVF